MNATLPRQRTTRRRSRPAWGRAIPARQAPDNRNGKSFSGHMLQVGMGEASGIVRRAASTPARLSESGVAD